MGLTVSHLTKKYGDKTVVEDLTFSMDRPGVYALLGTNGAGKTTSIRMMLGMLEKDSGQVLWNGQELSAATCNIGYLAEERGLYPKYALMDQLLYFATLRGVSREVAKERIAYWAKRLEVEEYIYAQTEEGAPRTGLFGRSGTPKKKKPKTADQLSKGNQQKIQFMIALLSDPDLLVLDEPLSGLDPVNTDLFKSILREQIARGKYLILSSHQMATVEEFCTDITILNRAKTVLQGNLNALKKERGRIHLTLKTEGDASAAIAQSGAILLSEKEQEYRLRVQGEAQANALLSALIAAGITVVTFDLREPTLHEIFVETVGGEAHENA